MELTHPQRERLREIILARTERDPDTHCWIWTSTFTRQGYGILNYLNKPKTASRWALIVFKNHGRDVAGHQACHTCDNPACANPDHLYWGTPRQNANDRERRKEEEAFADAVAR